MTRGDDEKPQASLLSMLITGRTHPWLTLGIGLFLGVAPPAVAYLDGFRGEHFSQGYWRLGFLPGAAIIYILVVAPILARGEDRVVEAFRSLVLVDDDSFNGLVREASIHSTLGEAAASGIGPIFGLVVGQSWLSGPHTLLLRLYLTIAGGLMSGLLGWVIYVSVAGTRLTPGLHRQPLRVDIFNIKPFEPIGRQSSVIAMVFVGGIALSIVLGGGLASLTVWQNWVIYPLLAVVPIVLFFLNMRDTHSVISAEKNRGLTAVQRKIVLASRSLMELLDTDRSTDSLGAEITALMGYEKHIQAARTWPYNTTMIRTLFVSIVVPGGAAAAGIVSDMLFR
jgi:hypothetical protein